MRIVAQDGWGIASKRVLRDSGLSPQAKGLYALLTTYADGRRRDCFVGRERLADDLGVSVRTVSTLLKELGDRGHVTRASRGRYRSKATVLNDFIVVSDED